MLHKISAELAELHAKAEEAIEEEREERADLRLECLRLAIAHHPEGAEHGSVVTMAEKFIDFVLEEGEHTPE